jgi:hypothetical protein
LRLPLSLKAAVEKFAAADGTSMNQFLVMAAAEKLTAMQTTDAFFAERKGRGDKEAATTVRPSVITYKLDTIGNDAVYSAHGEQTLLRG